MRSPQENAWADNVIAKAKAAGTIIGSKETPELVLEYASKFHKKIKEGALKCWFWRREKTAKNKKSKNDVFGKGIRHTDEENQWAMGVLSRMRAEMYKVGHRAIGEMGVAGEFQKQFGRPITIGALYTWLRLLDGKKSGRKKKDLMGQLMDEMTKYLLLVNNIPVTFDSEESLRSAIENPEVGQVMNNVKLFTVTPINIKREITVSIGK